MHFDVDRDTLKQLWLRNKLITINNNIPDKIYINNNIINGVLYDIIKKVKEHNKQYFMAEINNIIINVNSKDNDILHGEFSITYIEPYDITAKSSDKNYNSKKSIKSGFDINLSKQTHFKENKVELSILNGIFLVLDELYCNNIFGMYDIVEAFGMADGVDYADDYDMLVHDLYDVLSICANKYRPFVFLLDEWFENYFEYRDTMEQVFYKFMRLFIPDIPIWESVNTSYKNFNTAEKIIYNTEFDVEFDNKEKIHTLKTSIKDYDTGEFIYYHKASTMNKTPKYIVQDLIMKSVFNFVYYQMLDNNPDNLIEVEYARLCDMMISDSLLEYKGGYK